MAVGAPPRDRAVGCAVGEGSQAVRTLGSGNHFFELCVDERTRVWVVLHSGSRGIGNQLAQMHIATARQLAKNLQLHLEDPDLAYFTQGTPEFDEYIADMLWAQDYARANRDQMMDNAMRAVLGFIGFGREMQRIQCHHNFTQREVHDGRELWITRKGAIKADVDDLGVIPGSMGTRSYIVRGRGNAASWMSCSHGAGRRHSRTKAKKLWSAADLAEQMKGKVWLADRAGALVDEIPSAYKDIDASWPTRPTSSRSCTRCTRSSTTREPESRVVLPGQRCMLCMRICPGNHATTCRRGPEGKDARFVLERQRVRSSPPAPRS